MQQNNVAGSGPYSHEVPSAPYSVVLMRDGAHDGTEVYRAPRSTYDPDGPAVWRFVTLSGSSARVQTAERCALVRGLAADDAPEVCACDYSTRDGLTLIGVDEDDDLEWLTDGAEVLWDSAHD